MRLSVVIPTHNRPDLLDDCLRTVTEQEPPPGGMEIVVVDDGSRDPIDLGGIESAVPLRCVREQGVGLNRARDRGVAESQGELIAFLDDDTLVRPGWAAAVHDAFKQAQCDAVGGRIVLRVEGGGPMPDWVSRRQLSYLSRYDLGSEPMRVGRRTLPFGANFALTREILGAVGGFRADLDRSGDELISNGETELLRRILETDGRIVYWPAAEVVHRVPAERLTRSWFRQRAIAQGASDVRTEPAGARTDALVLAVMRFREVLRALRDVPNLARQLLEERRSFDLTLWRAYSKGRWDELRRLRVKP